MAKPQPERENLASLVERVTFHNGTAFCVLRVKARGRRDLVTVVSHAASISAGEFVHASGRWVNDRTHGLQFRAATNHIQHLRACLPHFAQYDAFYGDCQSVCAGVRFLIKRIGEPKPHYVRSRALGSTSTSHFAQLRRFTLLYANNLTSLR